MGTVTGFVSGRVQQPQPTPRLCSLHALTTHSTEDLTGKRAPTENPTLVSAFLPPEPCETNLCCPSPSVQGALGRQPELGRHSNKAFTAVCPEAFAPHCHRDRLPQASRLKPTQIYDLLFGRSEVQSQPCWANMGAGAFQRFSGKNAFPLLDAA